MDELCIIIVYVSGPQYWNILPIDIKNLGSIDLFKKYLKLFLLYLYEVIHTFPCIHKICLGIPLS